MLVASLMLSFCYKITPAIGNPDFPESVKYPDITGFKTMVISYQTKYGHVHILWDVLLVTYLWDKLWMISNVLIYDHPVVNELLSSMKYQPNHVIFWAKILSKPTKNEYPFIGILIPPMPTPSSKLQMMSILWSSDYQRIDFILQVSTRKCPTFEDNIVITYKNQ